MLDSKTERWGKAKQAALALLIALVAATVGLTGCSGADDGEARDSATEATARDQGAQSTGEEPEAAASDEAATSADQAAEISVTVNVVAPEDRVLADRLPVTIPEGQSALDALKATGLNVVAVDSEYGPFVEAIDDVTNEGKGGWTYTVNGESPSVSAGEYKLAQGDAVDWNYYQG